MSESEFWSDACQDAWNNAHESASENNVPGVLAALLTLFVAMQQFEKDDKMVLRIYLKLRKNNSPIYLLSRKADTDKEKFYLPTVENGQICYKTVKNQLFVQLETSAQHDAIIKEEWGDFATHNAALVISGFYLPPTEVAQCKILK